MEFLKDIKRNDRSFTWASCGRKMAHSLPWTFPTRSLPARKPISPVTATISAPLHASTIKEARTHCTKCAVATATERLVDAARIGRVAAQRPDARKKHAESERRHALARSAWDPASQPAWLTSDVFAQKIQPLLAKVSNAAIRSAIGVSCWYAGRIRQGYRPHPRHWQTLLELVRIQL